MKISKLIENLKEVYEKEGDIECVTMVTVWDETFESTIENFMITDFLNKKALLLTD